MADIRRWDQVRAGDFVRGTDGVVYQVLIMLEGMARVWRPDMKMPASFPVPVDKTVEIVERGTTGRAVDNLRAAGFAVDVIREDEAEPWTP